MERWRPITGFVRYEVSDAGRVRNTATGQILQPLFRKGYPGVSLYREGEHRVTDVHRLVAAAFLPATGEPMVRHLNGDPSDARLENLARGDARSNAQDMLRHGRSRKANQTACTNGHPFDDVNTYRRPSGHRDCRTCIRARVAAYRARRRTATSTKPLTKEIA